MPKNDPASDKYTGGAGVTLVEFDDMNFEDIEDGDLFWFSDNPNSDQNHAFRKIDEDNAEDTRTGHIANNINIRRTVYQKT